MKKILLTFMVVVSLFGFAGCSQTSTNSIKPIVAVSIVPEKAFVEAVAGDLVNVITLIPPGYSPENYEPSNKTMAELNNAKVYFTIGVPTESGNILSDISNINVVHLEDAVSDVYPDRLFSDGGRDPHIWLSIQRVKVMVETIANTLSQIDPQNEAVYQSNKTIYFGMLDDVKNQIEAIFADKTMRTFFAYHPAFGYFADEFGLTMVAMEEEGKEATIQHLNDVIDLAEHLNIHTVFYQIEIDSSQVNSFAEEINGESVSLNPLSDDYINNLLEMANQIGDALR